jgi:hypothetical protein
MVEAELDAMIRSHHDQRVQTEGERLEEKLWQESERKHSARRREENRVAWLGYHRAAAERTRRPLEALIARHEAAAQVLEQEDDQERRNI